MTRIVIVAALTAGFAIGHHSYGDYDRESPVTLEGTIKHVVWANPHVVLTLETKGAGEYRVEWQGLFQLTRQGINAAPVKEGDRVTVTGSVNRNPEIRILTLVRRISRPSDSWAWVDARYANPNSQGK
jgi:hypothetical protein